MHDLDLLSLVFRFSYPLLGFLFLPFLLFSVLPLSGFPNARFRSHFFGFLFLLDLISHLSVPDSRTRLSVRFLSFFSVSLPQPFHR